MRLGLSVLLLTCVVGIALVGLMMDGNWPKVLLIALSFAAGAMSGLVRPDPHIPRLVASVLGGPLLGMVHALGLSRIPALALHPPAEKGDHPKV